MMMKLERLHEIFDENPDKTVIAFKGQCHDCKNEVNVDIIEVEAIEKPADLDTPAPVVTSLVQPP